uniref:Uncharacterized protein n=1 Tax=Salix viminalis TaxID=40686 RepID=A0A6N2KBZ5_SALVM
MGVLLGVLGGDSSFLSISELELSHQTIKEEARLCPLILRVPMARHSLLQIFQILFISALYCNLVCAGVTALALQQSM